MAPTTHLKIFLRMSAVVLFLEGADCKRSLLELPSTTAPPATEVVGLRGYARFHANDSYVGQPVPCTHDEKVCLRHNLIFDPKTDRCQPPGDGGHGCFLRASRQEFEHGSGHIVGVCQKYDDPCSNGLRYRMAYDGRCYDQKVVFDDLCACESSPTLHFLGGWECRCKPSEPVQVEQPEQEGRCLIPDFRERHPSTFEYFDHPLITVQRPEVVLNCTNAEQRRCFEQEKVWVEGAQGCHPLLKRGPCPADHVVAMDGRAAEQRRDAEATCVHVRGSCPEGQIRMAFDGECHVQREVTIGAPGVVQLNVYGIYEVLDYAQSVLYTPRIKEDKCVVKFLRFWPPLGER